MPHIEWGTALYQLFVFIILFLLMRKYALKPIAGVMEARHQKITNDIATAEKNRAEALKLLGEQQAALKQAKTEASQIIETARVTADKQAEDMIRKATEEVEQLKKQAAVDINREKQQAVEVLHQQVAALSLALATKIIEKELDDKQQEKLVVDFLKEVGEAK